MNISILHVCPRPSFSGLEAYAFSLALDQKLRGLEVSMMVLPNSPLAEKCSSAKLTSISERQDLRTGILTGRWQLLHLHSTQDLSIVLPSLFLAKLRGTKLPKVILQTHILISHSKKDPIHFLEYLFVDEMWCSSLPAQKLLQRFIPIAKEKIKIVRYGRDIAKTLKGFLPREEARRELGIDSEALAVGLVSRIDPQKGIKEFLEGAIPLMSKYPKLNLIFIGGKTEDDPKAWAYAEALEKFHRELPPEISSRIHFKGAMKDSFRYMPGLDLYALPSYKECFALSLLEAQLAKLTVLGTSSGGTPDLVIEDQTGFLFEPESASSAGHALERALKSESRWKEFGERAQTRMFKEFDFEKISASIVEKYRALIL